MPFVVNDVVYIRCVYSTSTLLTLPAERLAGQLSQSKGFPSRIRVHPVPTSRFFSNHLWPMLRAIGLLGQNLASWPPTRMKWLLHNDLQKRKKRPVHQTIALAAWALT